MERYIQIRNGPEDLHRTLKSRAALAGLSLSDYLLQEARNIAERATVEELCQRRSVQGAIDSAALIREGRGPLPRCANPGVIPGSSTESSPFRPG